jgi:hypothetical protein
MTHSTITPACPYCSKASMLATGRDVYGRSCIGHEYETLPFYHCRSCEAWVGCHPGTKNPLGRLANGALRKAKQAAHEAFDALWKPGPRQRTSSRSRAYFWLSNRLRMKSEDCHIGMFDVAQCKEVVEVCELAHGPAAFQLGRL